MEEVFKQMKKYECTSQPKIDLNESFMKVINFLDSDSFGLRNKRNRASENSSIEEANLPDDSDLDPSVLEFPDEVIPFVFKHQSLKENPQARLQIKPPEEAIEKLKTLQRLKEKKDERPQKQPKIPKTFRKKRDYTYLEIPENEPKKADFKSLEEFVVKVQVFIPYYYKPNFLRPQRRSKFDTEFFILSSQTLLDLREVIVCMDDKRSLDGDVSENPKEASGRCYRDRYSSSMFFIDDTFYVDYSKPTFTDYSIVVKEWAKSHNIQLNHEAKDMSKTHIRDLKVKLNYPYLFQHLGDCEHLIQFVGTSILTERKSLCMAHYPMFTKILKIQGHMCMMCNKCYPTWIVVGYSRLPTEFSYLCKTCFKNYCYIGDKKIGSFKAYHFFDRRAYTDC